MDNKFSKEVWGEACKRVGWVVSEFQGLEFLLVALHAALAKCNFTQSWISFYNVPSKSKREIIESHALNYILGLTEQGKTEMADAHRPILKFMDRYKALTTKRNDIVHGQWLVDGEQPRRVYLSNNTEHMTALLDDPKTDKKAQSYHARKIYSFEDIETVAKDLNALKDDLLAYLQVQAPEVLRDPPRGL